jgi:hypothetical protein
VSRGADLHERARRRTHPFGTSALEHHVDDALAQRQKPLVLLRAERALADFSRRLVKKG